VLITENMFCLTDGTSKGECDQLLSYPGLPTPLQVFTQQGGLALLAQHLPLVYPETLRYSTPDKVSTPDALDAEWVKVDASDDIYEVNVCLIPFFVRLNTTYNC
jgi:baculoviral IAP repeat-containing protein 6